MSAAEWMDMDYPCPACGEYPDYCQGHGEIGDPYGREALQRHARGDHSVCVPSAQCEER